MNGPTGVGTGLRLYAQGIDAIQRGIDIAANGNIGIGNSSPYAKLDTYSTSNAQIVALLRRSTQGSGSTLVNDFGTPYLQIGGSEWYTANSIHSIGFGYVTSATDFPPAEIGLNTQSILGQTYGDIVFGTRTVTTNTRASERMRIAANGNIGIGNTTPASKLMIQGAAAQADANTSAGITLDINGAVIRVGDGAGVAYTFANGVGLKIADNSNVHYSVGQIGGKFVISDSSTDGNALYPASRTDIISANSTNFTVNVPIIFNSYTSLGYSSFVNIGLTTSATTANQVLSTFSATAYRSAKFLVQITSGSAYQATEITLIHDGTNVYKSEYGTVYTGAVLATFDADINSGNVRLLTTPTNAVTVYKGIATQILL